MHGVLTTLTDKQEPMVGAVRLTGVTAHGARLAAIAGIHFHRHGSSQRGFIGNVAMQFRKRPLGRMSVGLALLLRGLLASFPLGAFSNVRQVLQAENALWVLIDNVSTDDMVAILFQPSLSSTNHNQASCGGTSAFLLQPFSQPGIMIGLGAGLRAGIESGLILGSSGHSQVALTHIDPNNLLVGLWQWVGNLHFKRYQQVELLAGLVIPELGRSNLGSRLNKSHVLAIACVGHDHPSIQGEDAHLVIWLQAVIPMIIVGKRRGNVLGRVIQTLVPFLGEACLASRNILRYLCPQDFIGSADLARDVTGHLGGQAILQA